MKNRRRSISLIVIFAFILTSVVPYSNASAGQTGLGLPVPGTMVNLSAAYAPLLIKGLRVHPDNPLLFDFIVDSGNSTHKKDSKALRAESEKLIKYFLATLTIPEKDMWVNLSPYEQDRIIEQSLGETELGADMLAQDYILKQLTASLLYPEKEMGRKFWDKVYAQARERFGASASIPINTFNKVWILPDQADIVVRSNTAFVVAGHMKVMLEEDYLAGQKHEAAGKDNARSQSVAQQIVRDIVLPAIEREVNEGQNFAPLRQIFNSIVLASWYKKNLKEALLNQVYADQSKINGVDVNDKATKEKIYEQYLQAYKKGVFNYIKETHGPNGKMTPRKYFSGGEAWAGSVATNPKIVDNAQAAQLAPAGELFALRTMIEQQSVQRAGAGLQGDERGWRQILTMGQQGAVDMLDDRKPQIFAYSSKVSLWLKALFARYPQLYKQPLEVVIKENIGIPLTLEQARQIAQVLSPLQELPQEPGVKRPVVAASTKPAGGVKDSSRGIAAIIKTPVIDTLKAREIVERLTRDDRGLKKVEWRNGRWEYAVEASAAQGMASLSRADLENREPLKLWIKEFRSQNTGVSDDKLIPLMSRQIYGDETLEHLDAIEAAITVAEVSFRPKINWEGVGAADEAMRAVSTMTAANAVRLLMTGGQSAVSEKDLVDWYAQRKSQEMGLTDEGAADMLNVFGVNVSAVVLRGLLNRAQGHITEKAPAVIDAAMSSFTEGEFFGVPSGPWYVFVRKTYGTGTDILAAADVEITLKEGQAPIKIAPKLNRLQTGAEAARAILRKLQRLDPEVLSDPKAIERAVSADAAMASDRFGIEAFINELGDVSVILPPSDPRYGAITMLQGALGSKTLEADLPELRRQLDAIKMAATIRTFGMEDPTLGVTVRVAKPENNLGGNVDALIVTTVRGQNPREEHVSLPASLSAEQAVIDKLSLLRQQNQSVSTRVFDPLKSGVNAAMTSAPSDVLKVSDAIVKIARMRGTAEDIRLFKDWLERNGNPDPRIVGERLNFTEGLVRIVIMQAFPVEATAFNIDNTLEVATAVGRLAKKQGAPAQAQIFRVWLAAHQDLSDQQIAAALNLTEAQVMIAKQSIASDAAMLAELQKEHAVNLRAAIEARFAVLKDIEKRGGNKTIDFGAGRELRAEYDAIPDAAPEIIIPKLYDVLDVLKALNPDSPADAAMAGDPFFNTEESLKVARDIIQQMRETLNKEIVRRTINLTVVLLEWNASDPNDGAINELIRRLEKDEKNKVNITINQTLGGGRVALLHHADALPKGISERDFTLDKAFWVVRDVEESLGLESFSSPKAASNDQAMRSLEIAIEQYINTPELIAQTVKRIGRMKSVLDNDVVLPDGQSGVVLVGWRSADDNLDIDRRIVKVLEANRRIPVDVVILEERGRYTVVLKSKLRRNGEDVKRSREFDLAYQGLYQIEEALGVAKKTDDINQLPMDDESFPVSKGTEKAAFDKFISDPVKRKEAWQIMRIVALHLNGTKQVRGGEILYELMGGVKDNLVGNLAVFQEFARRVNQRLNFGVPPIRAIKHSKGSVVFVFPSWRISRTGEELDVLKRIIQEENTNLINELKDPAMNAPGGIDMNTANMNTNVAGEKINITFDKAMLENFKRGDFTGVRPVILNVTPIQSVLPLLGFAPKRDDDAA